MIGNWRSSSSTIKVTIIVSRYKIRTTRQIRPCRHITVEIIHDTRIKTPHFSRQSRLHNCSGMKGQGGGVHQWNNLWFRWCLNTKYTQILWCLMVPRRKLNDVMETGFRFWKRKRVSVSTFRFPLLESGNGFPTIIITLNSTILVTMCGLCTR